MILPLLAETIGSDTSVTLGLLMGAIGLVGGSVVAAIVSRVNHGNAIAQLRIDLATEKLARDDQAKRLRVLEEWKLVQEALDNAGVQASGSTTKGTRPYPRG
jgi:hypothetical protein